MHSRAPAHLLWTILLLGLLVGCMHPASEIPIEPVPVHDQDLGLGPGIRALTEGPGFKMSPSFGPRGKRIAFVVDGYVVEKPTGGGEAHRLTTTDLGAESVEWVSGDTLAILDLPDEPPEDTGTVYMSRPEDGSLQVREVSESAQAMSSVAGGVLVALRVSSNESRLSFVNASGQERVIVDGIEGLVTGLSTSPDGELAILAVLAPESSSELHIVDLSNGSESRLAEVEGHEIIGAPQWTDEGVYFVAGKEKTPDEESTGLFDLYRIPPGSDRPEPAPGVGGDFVAVGIEASPDGQRLAVIGRLSPNSPANVYLLDPSDRRLEALTKNEDMEIKAGPDDLDWSADGERLAIVARTKISGPKVRSGPADSLKTEFYNLYEIPVEQDERSG